MCVNKIILEKYINIICVMPNSSFHHVILCIYYWINITNACVINVVALVTPLYAV